MAVKTQKYEQNGVTVSKTTIYAGDEIILSYYGLLAQSGANNVFAHIGYGEGWDQKDFIQMSQEDGVFKAVFKVEQPGILNIAFKDCAENWDNNSMQNYSFKVSKKAAAEKKAPAKKTAAAETKKETKPVKKEAKAEKKEAAAPKKTVKKKA